MAQSVVRGGAVGIRANGTEDIRLIRSKVSVPLIGIWKSGRSGVVITPTLAHALAVADAGANIVALDGTRRLRQDGLSLHETIRRFRDHSDAQIMADVGSVGDGLFASEAGADMVSTTLVGYTGEVVRSDGPDLSVLQELASRLDIPVFAEGRIRVPSDAVAALEAGAFAAVVGTAITHPATLTEGFVDAVKASNSTYSGTNNDAECNKA